MVRRCSVIRIPLAAQRDSISEGCLSKLLTAASHRLSGALLAPSPSRRICFPSIEVAAQHQRRSQFAAGMRIVIRTPADLAEPGPAVETERGLVALVYLQKHRSDTRSRPGPQAEIETGPA